MTKNKSNIKTVWLRPRVKGANEINYGQQVEVVPGYTPKRGYVYVRILGDKTRKVHSISKKCLYDNNYTEGLGVQKWWFVDWVSLSLIRETYEPVI